MTGAPVFSGSIVLRLIEAVSPHDAVGMGDIDAYVFCNYANDGWEVADLQSWGPGDYYVQKENRLIVPVPKYTLFLNAQKVLRPPGWHWSSLSPGQGDQAEATGDGTFRSPVLASEELAGLHVLLQVIDYTRLLPKSAREIVMSRARRDNSLSAGAWLLPRLSERPDFSEERPRRSRLVG